MEMDGGGGNLRMEEFQVKLLVVIDMQTDFVDGALGTAEAAAIVPAVCSKIRAFDGKILTTMDTHDEDYLATQEGSQLPVVHCVYGENGWKFNEDVRESLVIRNDVWKAPFQKETFGSVDLAEYIRDLILNGVDIDEIVLIGLCTDICVISNALLLKAFLPEIKITVDAKCCAGVTPESHENALRAMKMCQINIENWEG